RGLQTAARLPSTGRVTDQYRSLVTTAVAGLHSLRPGARDRKQDRARDERDGADLQLDSRGTQKDGGGDRERGDRNEWSEGDRARCRPLSPQRKDRRTRPRVHDEPRDGARGGERRKRARQGEAERYQRRHDDREVWRPEARMDVSENRRQVALLGEREQI